MIDLDTLKYRKHHSDKYQSQVGQDIFIDALLGEKRDGFFVDIGANDGLRFSNTYFFEKYRHWTGILIEPLAAQFRMMQRLRSERSIKINACVSGLPCGKVNFLQAGGGMTAAF